jgi:hypothetical protein
MCTEDQFDHDRFSDDGNPHVPDERWTPSYWLALMVETEASTGLTEPLLEEARL